MGILYLIIQQLTGGISDRKNNAPSGCPLFEDKRKEAAILPKVAFPTCLGPVRKTIQRGKTSRS